MNRVLAIVLSGLLVLACGALQKPVHFTTTAKLDTAIETVVETLTSIGLRPQKVGRQSNVVQTRWKDSLVVNGKVKGKPATVLRRFVVTLLPEGDKLNVTIRMDGKRCQSIETKASGSDRHGPCEELTVMPKKLQEELYGLGQKLEQALKQ